MRKFSMSFGDWFLFGDQRSGLVQSYHDVVLLRFGTFDRLENIVNDPSPIDDNIKST